MAKVRKSKGFSWFSGELKPVGDSVLKSHILNSDDPLGALCVQGHDLNKLIRDESDPDILICAYARCRDAQDICWQMRIGDALIDVLGADAPISIFQLDTLIEADKFFEAKALMAKMDVSSVNPNRVLVWQARIAEGTGDLHAFEHYLEMFEAAATEPRSDLVLSMTKPLMARGQYTRTLALLDRLRDKSNARLNLQASALRLSAITLQEGPRVALALLEELSEVFPTGSAEYLEQVANLLTFQGRNDEACKQLAKAIALKPKRFDLYAPLQRAAFLADQRDVFDKAMERLSELDGKHQAVLSHRLEALSNNLEDAPKAKEQLDEIRSRSELQFQISSMLRATRSLDVAQVQTAYDNARAAGTSEYVCAMILTNYAFYTGSGDWDLKPMCQKFEFFGQRLHDQPTGLAIYLRLLIAIGQLEEARSILATCASGLLSHAVIAPFVMYFQAHDGLHDVAKESWQRYLQDTGNPSVSSKSAPPDEVTMNYKPSKDAILLFGVIFNGVEFIEWFLEHYRKLGVDHFFIVDNGSDDGTYELLKAQPDVSLHYQPSSFSEAKCGVVWINHLIQRFGVGHWCLHVDFDEALVFEGSDKGQNLRDLTERLDKEGAESLGAFMLDIYPEKTGDPIVGDAFEKSIYVDEDYVFLPFEMPPYSFVKGGIRGRISGQHLLMTKAPLVKVHSGFTYTVNNHHHSHLPISKERAVLLHYKFVGDVIGRVDEAIERGEHYLGARFYKMLKKPLNGGVLKDDFSILYKGPEHLSRLGYIVGPTEMSALD